MMTTLYSCCIRMFPNQGGGGGGGGGGDAFNPIPRYNLPAGNRLRGGDSRAETGSGGRQVVFIGVQMDEAALRAALDACLLTDPELAEPPAEWRKRMKDPFPAFDERHHHGHGHDHGERESDEEEEDSEEEGWGSEEEGGN
jgi:hypothetical protein